MVSPFAPNPDSAESQTHNEKSRNPLANVATQQEDNQTKFKQNRNESLSFDSRNPYSQHYQSNAKIWELYLDETKAEQKEREQLLNIGSDLLVFAGLLGAIVTTFLIESRKDLTEDPLQAILHVLRNDSTATSEPFKPTKSSLVVNAFWFSSLALTLISALAAVLARGWLAQYKPAIPGLSSNDACEHHLRSLRAQQWHLDTVVAGIPLFIQMALFFFAIGLVILTLNNNVGIGILLFVLTILATILYFFGTILPWFSPACPFQTTMSDFIPGTAMRRRYPHSALWKTYGPTPPKQLSLRERISLRWKRFNDFLIETHRKPEQAETEADILAWMLTRANTDVAMEEAVKAVAGVNRNQYLRGTLEKSCAGRILIDRFVRCVKVVPGLPINGDERLVEPYLYAMLRIVEPANGGDQDKDNVLYMKKSLLQVGQPLHRWEDYTAYLQPLAFALRIRILLATGCDDDSLQWEQSERDLMTMSTMGLAPYTRWILVNTTVEGLLVGEKYVRKMSAIVLAKQLQIPDTRYMLGKGNRGDKVVLEMAEILKESGDLNILEALLRMARCFDFQISISTIIHKIVGLLNHEKEDVRVAAEDALLKLNEQAELQPFIDIGIPDIVHMLKNSNVYIPMAGVDALWKLSKKVECRLETALTGIIALLNDSDEYICAAGISVLGKLSEHAEFRPLIETLIPDMVKNLNDGRRKVQEASADALCNLSVYTEFQPLIMIAIPEIINFFKNSDVQETAEHPLLRLSKQAEFRPMIRTLIPEIIEHLNDGSLSVHASLTLLSILAVYAEFQSLICTAIPKIITLIKNGDRNVAPRPGLCDLLKISDHTEFQPFIEPIIPEMIAWLKADDFSQMQGAGTLSKLSEYAKFQPLIGTAIPQIIDLLKDYNMYVQKAGADALSKLAEQVEFQPLIKTAIPQIITLLKSNYSGVRKGATDALSKLSEQAEFQSLITNAIPEIIALLKDSDSDVQKAGTDALLKLSEQAEFQPCITTAIPEIITLFKDSALHVQEAGAHAVLKLSDHIVFQPLIETASVLPELINLLKYNQTASIGAKFLCKLSKKTEHKNAISNAIWSALRHNNSSQFVVNYMEAKENSPADGLSIGGDAAHLMSYWINDNRFNIASGVCIMAKLHNYAQMCDSQILADFCTSHALGEYARTCAELNITIRLSEQDKASNFQRSTIIKVPDIIKFLKDKDKRIQKAASYALRKLSEQAIFQPLIKTAIPEVIAFLKDHHREEGAGILSKLPEYAELQHLTEMAIPGLTDTSETITLLKNSDQYVQKGGANALSKQLEQTELIGTVIPEIITLLKDDENEYNNMADAGAISKCSEHAKFQSLIETAISEIITLLKDNDSYALEPDANVFLKPSEYAKFQPLIGTLIPAIITHLNNNSWASKLRAADALSKLSINAEFQPLIKPAIPGIIALLRNRDRDIQRAGADALSKISEQTEFQPLIEAAIPDIISLLKDGNKDFWPAAADALSKLSIHAKFQPLIRTIVPDIIALLKDNEEDVQKPDSGFTILQSGEIKSYKEHVWKTGADALVKLSEQVEFQPLIVNDILEIVALLKANSKHIRQAGANVLLKLCKKNYFLHYHQDLFSAIMAILLSHNTPLDTVPICTHIFAHHAFNGKLLTLTLLL